MVEHLLRRMSNFASHKTTRYSRTTVRGRLFENDRRGVKLLHGVLGKRYLHLDGWGIFSPAEKRAGDTKDH